MIDLLTEVIKCISESSTNRKFDECMRTFTNNVFDSLTTKEQNQIQKSFIDTARSIDLIAYKKIILVIILVACILCGFIFVMIFYFIFQTHKCCKKSGKGDNTYSYQNVTNTSLLKPN